MNLRVACLALTLLVPFTNSALAASSTYRLTLAKGTKALTTQSVTATTGVEASVEHKVPFGVSVGGCVASNGKAPLTVSGTGRSGQLVTVNQVDVDARNATVRVALDNNEFSDVLATKAGSCSGQTPAMLHWDASATFTLGLGESNSFSVGEYTVVVTLLFTTPDRQPGFSL